MGKLITDHLFRRVEALEKRIEELEGKLRFEFSKIDPVYVPEISEEDFQRARNSITAALLNPVKNPWKGKP